MQTFVLACHFPQSDRQQMQLIEVGLTRRAVACLACRRKKHKCDGLKPMCTRCVRSRRDTVCVYEKSCSSETPKTPEPRISPQLMNVQSPYGAPPSISMSDKPTQSDERWEVLALGSRYQNVGNGDLVQYEGHKWWESEDLPLVLKDYLIGVFIQHSAQFDFDPFLQSFLTRIQNYPPHHASYPHLSLLNAIYLLSSFCLVSPSHPSRACTTIQWDFRQAEAAFLRKTRDSLARNIAMVENMLDFLVATCMLSKYFYAKGRYEEGHHAAAGAVRLCIACKLHAISSPHVLSYFPISILPKPADASEVRDRVDVFWLAFTLDRYGSMCCGLNNSVLDEDITTVFPQSSFGPSNYDFYTVLSLYDPQCPALNVGGDSLHGMKAKLGSLLNEVRRVVVSMEESVNATSRIPPKFMDSWSSLEKALTRYIGSLPALPSTHDGDTFSRESLIRLIHIYTLANGAMILLHGNFWETSKESHSKALTAAQDTISKTKHLERVPEVYWDLCLNMGWVNACEVLQREIRRLEGGGRLVKGHESIATRGRQDMEYLSNMCHRLEIIYPDHSKVSVDHIQGLLDGLDR